MFRSLIYQLRPSCGISRVGMPVVLLVALAGLAHGQGWPQIPQDPYWSPEQIKARQDQANQWEKQKQEASPEKQREYAQAQVRAELDKQRKGMWAELWNHFSVQIMFIGVVLLIWLAGWAYLRFCIPTNPLRVAQSDPWVRAHLAQAKAPANSDTPTGTAPDASSPRR
jgi:hypothetical protein